MLRKKNKELTKSVEKKKIAVRYDLKAVSWCMNNGYKLYPKPIDKNYIIILEYKGVKAESEKIYTKNNWSDKIWQTYEHIYKTKCLEKKQ